MSSTSATLGEQALRETVADALLALANVSMGDYATRLHTNLAEDNPLALLYSGINEMIQSLEAGQRQNAAYQRELEEKIATIEQQRAAIRELSTPIMEVWNGVLCLPIVGVVDTVRSAEMTSALLRTIVEKQTRCAIIDITGIEVMDTSTAEHFIRMARAVRLLGAKCVITGINPHIAQTIVHMGVELADVVTHRTLRDALHQHVNSAEQETRTLKGEPGGR